MATVKNLVVEPELVLRRFSFTPASGPVGTEVTLSGNALSSPVSLVLFNGTAASRRVSGNTIIAIVPQGATDGPITLQFADGSSVSSLSNFDVTSGIADPKINSFFPASGPVGAQVQLNGSGFTGATAVRFGGVAAAQVNIQGDTNIIVTVPNNALDGFITVERNGVVGTSPTAFDVTTNTLSINGFSPSSGVSGIQVNIVGNGFSGVDTVLFGTMSANFIVVNDGLISAFAPAALPGTLVSITVKKGVSSANSGSLKFLFADNAGLAISSFSPTSGPEGTPIQVFGTGFIGVSAAFIGPSQTAFSVQSDTNMVVWVPTGAQDGPIRLMEGGVTVQSGTNFDVTTGTPFNISGVNPPMGAPGTEVTISGSGFLGVDTVLFGNIAASFSIATGNRIVAFAPNNPAGSSVNVILRKGAQQVSSAPLVYNYPAIGGGGTPKITSLSPNPAFAGAEVRILGSGFTGATMVKIGLLRIVFQFISDSELRIIVPDFAQSGRVSVTNASGTGTSATNLVIF